MERQQLMFNQDLLCRVTEAYDSEPSYGSRDASTVRFRSTRHKFQLDQNFSFRAVSESGEGSVRLPENF